MQTLITITSFLVFDILLLWLLLWIMDIVCKRWVLLKQIMNVADDMTEEDYKEFERIAKKYVFDKI